jgi:hypothetical protein
MSTVKTEHGFLGKKDPVESPFAEFKTYFADALGAPPSSAHYGARVTTPWQMDGNGPDPELKIAPANWPGCGDCTEVGKRNALVTANFDESGHTVPVPTPDEVVQQYCVAQNCTPAQLFADPNTYDNGEDESTTLTTWCTTVEYGVKLGFTAPVNAKSQNDLKNALYLSGGLYIGIQLPESAESQFPNGGWTWVPGSPIAGGHCVWLTGYTTEYVALVTWGKLIHATWQFILNTIDEAHVLVLPQAIAAGKSPTGLLISKWESDLRNLNA